MLFNNNVQPLGEGRVTSAISDGDTIKLLVKLDGAVVVRMLTKRRIARDNVVSYAEECYFAGKDIIERRGRDLVYAEKN